MPIPNTTTTDQRLPFLQTTPMTKPMPARNGVYLSIYTSSPLSLPTNQTWLTFKTLNMHYYHENLTKYNMKRYELWDLLPFLEPLDGRSLGLGDGSSLKQIEIRLNLHACRFNTEPVVFEWRKLGQLGLGFRHAMEI